MNQTVLLSEIKPSLPSDWTPYAFLVLELKASSAQYFELCIHSGGEARAVRLHPFQGVWIRAAVPLIYFKHQQQDGYDLASLGNKPRSTFFVTFARGQGPLDGVESIQFVIPNPVGNPTVDVRSIGLSKEDPGDAVLDAVPLVDEFGQWIPEDWPAKAHSLEQLKREWHAEEQTLRPGEFATGRYGGFLDIKAEATGFFRVAEIDRRWWFVDPEGRLFFSAGADVMVPWMETRVAGRQSVFTALPPTDLPGPAREGARSSGVSYPTWNLLRRYGPDWQRKWIDMTLRRMDAWGLNTIANWSDPRLFEARRKPYVALLGGWGIETGVMGLPDIYAADYLRTVDESAARQCAPRKDDPWLLGYFVANEPAWPERELLAAQSILDGRDTATRRALREFLAGGDTPQRRKAFIYQSFEKFLAIILAAIKRHDPNHLTLGIRFGGSPPADVVRMARVFDVYSHNIYSYAPEPGFLDRLHLLTGRPILLGEFHFGAPGGGLSAGLGQTRDRLERGVAYRYYLENAAAHPALIGAHWFQWWDQPNTGRSDGENYNIGLVDVTDRPYPEMVAAMQASHARLLAVHSGAEPPFDRLPQGRGEVIPYDGR